MQKKSFVVLHALMFCVISFTCHAQAKRDSIKVLFHVMQQDSLINKSFDLIVASMRKQMQNQLSMVSSELNNPDTALITNSAYRRMMDSTMQDIMAASKKAVQALLAIDMVDIYDKYFTQEQINDFLIFYRSPSGQALVTTLPGIQKDVLDVMAKKYTPAIQEAYLRQIKKMIDPLKQ